MVRQTIETRPKLYARKDKKGREFYAGEGWEIAKESRLGPCCASEEP